MSRPTTPERYDYQSLLPGNGQACPPRALFTVTAGGGRSREEILGFPTIEVRIRLWEEALAEDPHRRWRDPNGQHNFDTYIRALVEGVKTFSI